MSRQPNLTDVIRALRALAESCTAEPAAHINHAGVVEMALAQKSPATPSETRRVSTETPEK